MTDAIITCSEHFTELALNELRRYHKHLDCVKAPSPQHLYIRNPGTFGELTGPWKDKLPVYLHHAFPVHHALPLTGTLADFSLLREYADQLCRDDYTVQTRVVSEDYPYSATSITHSIMPEQNKNRHTLSKGRVLSILIDGQTAYMGISWGTQNLSTFSGGKVYFHEPVPNRAGLKLLEALSTFDIQLYPGTHALDLGAAPGAWTEMLRRRHVCVTAVAPQEMYDWLQTDPNVRSFHLTAEEYLTQCDRVYDLLVNDMKMDAQDSAQLMVDYARHLRPGGIAIMTLKLRMRHPRRLMDHAFRLLRKAYKIIHVRQLVHNRREVTLYLRKHH